MFSTAKTSLILIPSNELNIPFTESIAKVLRDDFKLGDRVEVFSPKTNKQAKELDIPRGAKSPLVSDKFGNTEPRLESGKVQLYDLKDSYIAVVKHLYDYPVSGMSVPYNLMEVRYWFDMFNEANLPTVRKVLVTPYLPLLGSHNNEKYQKMGFFEPNRMGLFIDDLVSVGVQDLFSIHPHTQDIITECNHKGIVPHMKDSFTGPIDTDYCKLGFRTREEAMDILKKIHPYTTHMEETASQLGENGRIVGATPDISAEQLMCMVVKGTKDETICYSDLLSYLKERTGEGESKIVGVKSFSGVKLEELSGTTDIVADDFIRTGTSVNLVAGDLKSHGAKSVEAWVTHGEFPKVKDISHLPNIDKVVCLNTMLHRVKGVTYLPGAECILAASIYRNYCHELDKRGEDLSFVSNN